MVNHDSEFGLNWNSSARCDKRNIADRLFGCDQKSHAILSAVSLCLRKLIEISFNPKLFHYKLVAIDTTI